MMKTFFLTLLTVGFLTSCMHKGPSNSSPAPETAKSPAPATPKTSEEKKAEVAARTDDSLHPRGLDFGATIKTIAFSSSANQDLAQPIWKAISENKPDVFLMMGDAIQSAKPDQKFLPEQYRKMEQIPEYRAFREKVPFMATWDDQDFGQKEFLNNWTYVRHSVGFGQNGIYHSKLIGPKNKQVHIIMLDTRTFRTSADVAKPTLLGETQWDWLEAQLKRKADLRLIVTSVPLVASETGEDKWSKYPQERQRFFDLLKKTRAQNVVVLSGDRRQSSIAKTGLKDWGILFDVTASPINEPLASAEKDPSYEGDAFAVESFGLAQVDWSGRRMTLQIRDASNKTLQSVTYKIH